MHRRTFVKGSIATALATAAGVVLSRAPAFALSSTGHLSSVITEHPRLLLRSFDHLRTLIAGDELAASWYAKVKSDADTILDLPVSEYVIPDGLRLLSTSREVLRRTYSLALAHAIEDDAVYAERLWAELKAVAEFPDWNSHRHFLDTAEMTHAVAIGYDWLFHTWTPEQRAVLRTALVEMGLNPGADGYRSGAWWSNTTNNWNIVCNGGLSIGALALADEEPELCQFVLERARSLIPLAIAEYAPDGGYPEGLGSYWGYATKYLVAYVAALQSATGSDDGLADSPGLATTGLFPIHLTGPSGENFNYYDAGAGSPQPPEMFWLASTYDNPVFAWWGAQGMTKNPISWFQSPLALLWYQPGALASPLEAGLPLDCYFGRCEVATMRGGWETPTASFVGFKGGENWTNHGDLDLGTFVFDALGIRWAVELGSDYYNMPGYFNGNPGGERWTYYRKRAEGQNTLVAAPKSGDDQQVTAAGRITERASGPTAAFAIADLTEAHPELSSWRRGARLFDRRQQLVIQDEISADSPVEVWWFMHTTATITVADDGRSALLERAGQRLLARITSPGEAVFYNAPARPLWTSPEPSVQNTNRGIRKLAIRLRDVTDTRLTVQLTPLRAGQETPDPEPVTPLSQWDTGPDQVAQLASISVDGKPLDGFAPATFAYDMRLPASAPLPTITAKAANPQARVIVHPVRRAPGRAAIEVLEPGKPRGRYEVWVDRATGPGSFPSTIIASTDDGNVPENTMDGDLSTRWSAEGDGQWIAYDMGSDGPVSSVQIAWYQGDVRSARFDIEVAAEGETEWRRVFSGTSSGTQTTLETYTFEETTARYLRIVGHGNSANAWNSITEVVIPGRTVELPQVEPYLAEVELIAPDSLMLGETATLEIRGTMSDGSEADLSAASVTFASADPEVATVEEDGTLVAHAEGTVTVAGVVVTQDWRLEWGRREVTVVDPSKRRFTATADTYVNDGQHADTNYGGSSSLTVKTVRRADSGYNRQAFLRFEPTAIEEPIESVTLYFHANVSDSEGTEIDLLVHALDGTFDEYTTTWNTKPPLGERLGSVHVTSTAAWYGVDLTEGLRDAVAAGQPINLALTQEEGVDGLATQVRSRESSQAPYLLVQLADDQ
jgi:hypothetical protein